MGGEDGKLISSTQHNLRVMPQADGSEPFRYQFLHRLELKSGSYSIRVAALSRTQEKTGSLFADVHVPDFMRDPISLSGILLEEDPAPVSVPRAPMAGLPVALPTTARQFSATSRVSGIVRLYQGGRRTLEPVSVDIAIIDAVDRVAWSTTAVLNAAQFSKGRATEQRFALPLDTLGPGPYLLRVTARLPNGRVATEMVRIAVK
jgi:hypothetical protein